MADLHHSDKRHSRLEPRLAELREVSSLTDNLGGSPLDGSDRALGGAIDRQRRVARLLSSAGPVTPPALRARLDALEHRAGKTRDAEPARRLLTDRRRAVAVSALSGCVAIAAAVVLATGALSPGSLQATRVAEVWTSPATSDMVQANPTDPGELAVSFHRTAFPAYRDSEGWHAVGSRSDRIDGKAIFTVFYATGTRRAAYTVVAGTRVSVPSTAEHLVAGGLSLAEFRAGNRWIIVFRDHGNTCVLTAAAPREKTWLVKLAVWHVNGSSPVD